MDDSNINTKGLLMAGGVATVVLLGAAWWYAAATHDRVASEAVDYAAEIEAKAAAAASAAIADGSAEPSMPETTVAAVEEAPAEEVVEAPAEEAPVEEVAEAPAEEAPVEEVAEAPAEEAPVEEVAEAPAEEAPVEEVVEAPAEEAPVEEVAEAPAEEAPVEEVAAAAVVAAALPGDAAKGARVFNKCKACHVVGAETNKVGPWLTGVVGRGVGAVADYKYSGVLADAGAAGDVWTPEALDAWLENPGGVYKGTKMAFKLRKAADRENVIAYLASAE